MLEEVLYLAKPRVSWILSLRRVFSCLLCSVVCAARTARRPAYNLPIDYLELDRILGTLAVGTCGEVAPPLVASEMATVKVELRRGFHTAIIVGIL